MTPANDNDLHEAIRRALSGHQPAAQPGDWERLRLRLRRRRRWRVAVIVGLLLLLGGVGVWIRGSKFEVETDSFVKTPVAERPGAPAVPASTPSRGTVAVRQNTLKRTGFFQGKKAISKTSLPHFTQRWEARPGKVEKQPWQPLAAWLPLPPIGSVPGILEREIIEQVLTGKFGADSTSFRALERNKSRWRNVVLVCDATTSMYPYVTQLLDWFRKNERNTAVKGIVLYTDCDSLGRQTDEARPGKFFVSRRRDVATLLPLLLAAARNTTANADRDENAAEALLFAQQQFPEAQTLVLVADGRSGVKDRAQLPALTKPVAIVQCGAPDEVELAFQPDYWNLARQTGGSLHTLEDDLKNVDRLPDDTWVRVGKQYYRYRRGRFVLSKFTERPVKVLFFWMGRQGNKE